MKPLHSLLKRQIRKHFPDGNAPPEFADFINAINQAYQEFDEDRNMLERALDYSSQELFEANVDLRALFEVFPDLLFRINHEGVILDCKAGKTAKLFLPADKLIGKKIQDVPSPSLRKDLDRHIARARESGETVSFEYATQWDEKAHHYEARILPFREKQLIVVVRNIDDRKKMEMQLMQSQKMDTVGTLAGGIAHDLNNQLVPLIGYLDLALSSLQETPIQAMLQEADQAAKRCADIVQRLVRFAKPSSQQKSPVLLEKILYEMGGLLPKILPATIQVKISCPGGLEYVYGNETELQTIFMNLATNARDAMPHGGFFEIEAQNVVINKGEKDKMPEKYVRVRIKDTGVGIPPEYLPRIYEPFFTTKSRSQGTGLGLAMVFNIIKDHDGWIDVSSVVQKGTAFDIYLPAAPALAGVPQDPPPAVLKSDLPTGNETVLLADDEAAVRGLAKSFLEKLGYKTMIAKDAEEAVETFSRCSQQIDAVILDMTMPKMSGRDVLRHLLKLKPSAKIILISGFTSEGSPEELIRAGAADFIRKPFTITPFAKSLRKVLDSQRN